MMTGMSRMVRANKSQILGSVLSNVLVPADMHY